MSRQGIHMQVERFGEGLNVEQKPGMLRLMIQPKPTRMIPDAWLILSILLLVLAAIGIGLYLWIGSPLSAFQPIDSSNLMIWVIWLAITGFIAAIPVMIKSGGWQRKVLLRAAHADGEEVLIVRIRYPFSFSRLKCDPKMIRGLRLYDGDPDIWRQNDKDKHVFAKADWWLLFETAGDVAYAINLPVDTAHVNRLAGMLSEIFGQECRVVETADEPTQE